MEHKKRYKKVLIEWIDSRGVTDRWELLKDLETSRPVKCLSIGFLLEDNADYAEIVQTIGDESSEDAQVIGRITIPKCSILKVREGEKPASRFNSGRI